MPKRMKECGKHHLQKLQQLVSKASTRQKTTTTYIRPGSFLLIAAAEETGTAGTHGSHARQARTIIRHHQLSVQRVALAV